MAVKVVIAMTNDEIIRVLPQLVEALGHETYDDSTLAFLLMARSLASPAVAHALFWLLLHSLPHVPQVLLIY